MGTVTGAVREWLVLPALIALAAQVACSGDDADDGDGRSGDDPFGNPTQLDGGLDPRTPGEISRLRIDPDSPTLTLQLDQPLPTLQFTVKAANGDTAAATFWIEDGEFGDIDANGLFTPSGRRGGTTFVEARAGSVVVRTELTIVIEWVQNGADPDPNAGMMSSGGYAGVGGEGPGGAVSDEVRAALDAEPTLDAALQWLYPYDRTVFPLGLLAPLLMWSESGVGAADGIALHLWGANFDYRGYFGRPPALAAGAAFVRHPIPQPVWEAATQTVAGGPLNVELVLAKDGSAYGPLRQIWTIARGRLVGTVYYQSYGTNLAKNLDGAVGGDGRFGGATLAIQPGATGPGLVAGSDGGYPECRVCHSVSSDGSRMTVQHGDDYETTSSYDLRNGYMEMGYPAALRSQLAWIGMTPDGALGLANGEPLAVDGDPITQLYDMQNGDVVPSSGLAGFVREAAFPAFAHDGLRVAFNFVRGPGDATIGMGDAKKLVAMDFDPMTRVFSNPELLYQGDSPAGWPSFSPTGNSVVYQLELERGRENRFFYTRYGGKGELWWTNLRSGAAHALARANGVDAGSAYLPRAAQNHDSDELLNYEPSVAPVATGGYAWMVFTSRRLYGNVATIDPWHSDPREHDLTQTPTTKKLWVAALDLDVMTPEFNVMVGEDPSHPAFYLPGQELLAGNTRGFWTVDPCKPDGDSCASGVECCSGYCQKDANGDLTCGRKTNECVQELNRCDTRRDCCNPMAACINHVCTLIQVE